MYLLPP
jgi:hypothetical protein